MVDQNLLEYLLKLGLSQESATIYLSLLGKKGQTAQEIAKATKVPKTTVYRRIDALKQIGLIEEQVEEYKKVFAATSADFFNLLIVKKEQEVKELRAQLPHIRHLLLGQFQSFDPETKVLFYRGQDGIQQMLWNMLKGKVDVVGFTYRDLTPFIGKSFSENWTKELRANRSTVKDIFSDEYIKSKFEAKTPDEVSWNLGDSRYIAPNILDITHQLDIYNNVVSIYNWHKGDIFGIEIYNEKVAKLQRQIFEVMWNMGEVYDLTKQQKRYRQLLISA